MRSSRQWGTAVLFLLLLPLWADEFPEPYNSEPPSRGNPTPAGEAAAALAVPEGFEVTVFASEPEVRNPIAMAWDHRGRMWVAENFTYAERGVRLAADLRDRILVFEDTDHDGRADKRTVFADDLKVLTSVETGRGGVWALCPPRLLFLPDRNGDDAPDGPAEVVLDGFTVAQGNHHNFANGLRWGPDGWLYGRCGHACPGDIGVPGTPKDERVPIRGGLWRYHPETRAVEVLTHGTINPWGHDWDEHGQLFFINTVIGHLWHATPGAHFAERTSTGSPNPLVFERLDHHADHYHYDRSGTWQQSRDGKANDFGGGHAHSGMVIYQGGRFPEEWSGRLLTLNLHGRRTNRERLERLGSGYVARHEPDAFLSGDQWFRGIDIRTGPEGSLYLLDWSDIGECHEHTGVHRQSGRIFRLSFGRPAKPDFSLFENPTPAAAAVVAALRNPNPWHERRMRNLLAGSKGSPELVTALTGLLETGADTTIRLRALWCLAGVQALGEERLRALLSDPDEHVRGWAIRFLTDHLPLDTIIGPSTRTADAFDADFLSRFVRMAGEDPSGLVRLTLASTLQRLPLASRGALAGALAQHPADGNDHNLPAMVWYGIHPLAKSDPEALLAVARATDWPDLLRWSARACALRIEEEGGPVVAGLLEEAARKPRQAPHILQGLSEAFRGWQKAPQPENWEEVRQKLADHEEVAGLLRELGTVFGDGRALAELKAVVFDGAAELPARRKALQTLISVGPPELRETCESLLKVRGLNGTAVRGLARFDDPAIGSHLAENYTKFFRPQERPPVVEVLASRPAWARALLAAIASGAIPRRDLTPFHARQIAAMEDGELTKVLREVWGDVRNSSREKRARIDQLKADLSAPVLAGANRGQGRVHYERLCASCHMLYGKGGRLGPDLTGSGRAELEYLLENIVDPSAVVSADQRARVLTLTDGRALSGVITRQDDKTLTLRTLAEETSVRKNQIVTDEELPASIMPEGLLETLPPHQVRDLIAYLMHPSQVPLPEETAKDPE